MIKCKLITCSTDDNPAPAPAVFYFNAALSVGCEDGTTLNQCTAPSSYPPGLSYNTSTKLVDVQAGIFRATTQAAANSLAVAYAQNFIQTEIDGARMNCGGNCHPFIILPDDEATAILSDECESIQTVGADIFYMPWGDGGIVGFQFGIFKSTDALNWSQIFANPDGNNPVYDIAFGNGIYVAVAQDFGGDGVAYTSVDLASWTRRTVISGSAISLWSVAFGNGVFVAGGDNNRIAWSADGSTWNDVGSIDAGGNNFYRIRFLNGNFYAINFFTGKVFTSSDGASWSLVGTFTGPGDIAYGNSVYVLIGDNAAYTSPDAVTWTPQTFSETGNGLVFGNGQFCAVTSQKHILTSPDGSTWTDSGLTADQALGAVTYLDQTYIAAESA